VFVQEPPILDRLPLIPVVGNAYRYNEESTLPGVSFRGVNEAYPESTGTLNQRIETLRKRLLGGQVLDAKGVGPVVNGHDFFDALDSLVAQVCGISGTNGALHMNAALRAKVESGFRRLGGAELLQAEIAGKRTTTWKGIPLLDAGQKLDGTVMRAAELLRKNGFAVDAELWEVDASDCSPCDNKVPDSHWPSTGVPSPPVSERGAGAPSCPLRHRGSPLPARHDTTRHDTDSERELWDTFHCWETPATPWSPSG
jgi:hypothetical protein